MKLFKSFLWQSLLGAAIASVMALPQAVQAQVVISPMVINAETKQGKASGVISVRNKASQPQRVRLNSEAFTYKRDGFTTQESDPFDLSPYLIFSPAELVVKPGQSRRIRLIMRMLPTTAPGEYRSVIFVEPLKERNAEGGLSISDRLGVTVYVRHGEVNFALAPESAAYNSEKKQLELLVTNPGNGTVRPAVQWELQRNGQAVIKNEVKEITVIAGGDRLIPLELPENSVELTSGTYQLTGELLWGSGKNSSKIPFSFDLSIP